MKNLILYAITTLGLFLFVVAQVSAQIPAYKSWLVNNSSIYTVSPNVGIGTTNPYQRAKLNVVSTDLDGIPLYVYGGPGTDAAIIERKSVNTLALFNSRNETEQAAGLLFLLLANDGHSYGFGRIQGGIEDNQLNTGFVSISTNDGTGNSPERMRVTSSGNVGIGTTSPAQKLSVAGIIESTLGGFKFPDGTIQITAGGGGAGAWASSENNIYNTNAGNVGIGTTSPAQKLDVNGSIQTSNQIISTAPNGTAPLSVSSATKVDNLNADMLDDLDSSSFSQLGNSIESAEITDNTIVNADVSPSAAITGTKILPTFGGQNILTMGNAGIGIMNPVGKLHVSGGNAIFDGSVGIGVINPTVRLDVTGPVRTSSQFVSAASPGIPPLVISSQTKVNNLNADLLDNLDSSSFSQLGNSIESAEITDNTITDADISPSASISGTKINPSFGGQNIITMGRVGIGVPSPALSLDVAGDVRWMGTLQGGSVPWARLVSFPSPCASGQFVTAIGNVLACASPPVSIGGSGTVNAIPKFATPTTIGDSVIYENAGNIGIGTTTPGEKLTVWGGMISAGSAYGGGRVLIGEDDGANVKIYTDGIRNLKLYAGGNIVLDDTINFPLGIWQSSGNVGIGTASPGAKLDVEGTGAGLTTFEVNGEDAVTGLIARFRRPADTETDIVLGTAGNNEAYIASERNLHLATGQSGQSLGTSRLTILSNGNVGIGTTNPAPFSRLHVYDPNDSTYLGVEGPVAGFSGLGLFTMGNGFTTLGSLGTKGWKIFAFGDQFLNAPLRNDLLFEFYNGSQTNTVLHIDGHSGNIAVSGSVVNEQGKPSFFVNVLSDDCGGSHPYLGCPAGYIQAGKWHTGGQCDTFVEGEGYENGQVDSGWMTLCVAV